MKRFEIGLIVETDYDETEEGVIALLKFLETCTVSKVRFIIHDAIERDARG